MTPDPFHDAPADLLHFVSMGNENFLVSLVESKNDLAIHRQLNDFYAAALSGVKVPPDGEVIYHLFTFTHYQFLQATAQLMRCHLAEALASARSAIDGALIAAMIIHDRPSQTAYLARTKPYDKPTRHLRNLVRNNKPLPHYMVPQLLKMHEGLSEFACHADVTSFLHRIREAPDGAKHTAGFEYFQFSRDADERQQHSLHLFTMFSSLLIVFSDYLVVERKAMPEEWRTNLLSLHDKMMDHFAAISEKIVAREAAKHGGSNTPGP